MISHIIAFFRSSQSDNSEHVRNWRLIVSGALVLVGIHIAWICGWLQFAGLQGVAFASDVDTKIESALKPVKTQLNVHDGYLKRLVKSDIRDEIYATYIEYCTEDDVDDRQELHQDIEDLQIEYEELTDKRYPLPSCDEL